MSGLVVTTSLNSVEACEPRAREVAARCGAPYVQRRGSLARARGEHDVAYVVGRDGEHVTDGVVRLAVDAGLLHAKVSAGEEHPLMRALGPAPRVFDATLGLAGDALHLAALGRQVVAAEASPAVFSLAERALQEPGERWAEAAARIEPHLGVADELLAGVEVDAVLIAPMFRVPARAAPGYALFRTLADHRPLDAETVAQARRAAPRVVVRLEKGAPLPGPEWDRLNGKAVDYAVWSR